MLLKLSIDNIALIDRLELDLSSGLNILSGETGAGKSIIIDSLNFVLGERADKSLIRYGTDFAVVQAVFDDYITSSVQQYLDDVGIDAEDVLIIRRKMSVDGKNECRINGRVTTLSILKGLTELLVDIHGQHEHQSLLKSCNHIRLLDSMGEGKIANALHDVKEAHKDYRSLLDELSRFGDSDERLRKLDVLFYQINEIENANIQDGEEEELLAMRKKIRNMEKILSALEGSISILEGYDNHSVSAQIKDVTQLLNSISSYDEDVLDISNRLDSAKLEISDISNTLKGLLDKLDFDSRTAEKIEQRLDIVRNIIRKYGGSFESLSDFLSHAKEEYDILSNAGETVEILQKNIAKSRDILLEKAKVLTEFRKEYAVIFESKITKELEDLGMGGSTFKVDIDTTTDIDEISSNGADRVEFLISPNKGEPLKPLAKIISGGEMSRFMLALKNIVAGLDGIQTMVFDEIDTGISGNISQVVSQKMCNISRDRQVIAVTHMPSLAAMADSHYLIAKHESDGKTLTSITLLDDDTNEVARLIGGNDYSQFAVPHALEMKSWAKRYKQSLSNK